MLDVGLSWRPLEGVAPMPRKESLIALHAILVRRRDALRSALAGDLSLLKELRSESPGDVIDAALDSTQDEISSQLAEVESRELGQIENALEHMRAGHYGVCEFCGGKIPMARLNALPYATMCIECQREVERTGIGPADRDESEESRENSLAGDREFDVS